MLVCPRLLAAASHRFLGFATILGKVKGELRKEKGAKNFRDVQAQVFEAGAVAFLYKPVYEQDLLGAIGATLKHGYKTDGLCPK